MRAGSEHDLERGVCCCVSVGDVAHAVLRDVPRDRGRHWYAVAVGPDAASARADETIFSSSEVLELRQRLLPRLEDAWRNAEFVYVVFDAKDGATRALACAIVAAAHTATRTSVAVVLGGTLAGGGEQRACSCDCVLWLPAPPTAPRAAAVAALQGLLSAFDMLWMPIDLDELRHRLRTVAEARVIARCSNAGTIRALLSEVLGAEPERLPSFLHVVHGERALRFRELHEALLSARLGDVEVSAGIGDGMRPDELLVASLVPLVDSDRRGCEAP